MEHCRTLLEISEPASGALPPQLFPLQRHSFLNSLVDFLFKRVGTPQAHDLGRELYTSESFDHCGSKEEEKRSQPNGRMHEGKAP
eukprot:1146496-Pelagomonas_calceolata.AAC.2